MNDYEKKQFEAYASVFGREGERSEHQEFVLFDLKKSFQTDLPVFRRSDSYDATAAAVRDGQRSVILHIEDRADGPVPGEQHQTKAKRE